MKVLIWHWGRFGAGPRFAAALSHGFSGLAHPILSLAAGAEILTLAIPPPCALPIHTYAGPLGFLARLATAPVLLRQLDRALARFAPDLAICAMPAMLDPLMFHALRRRQIPSLLIVHDAIPHPGERAPWRMAPQRLSLRQTGQIVALSPHVAGYLGAAIPVLRHPPFDFGPMPPPRAHGGKLRVLSFGRLLPYKGLDLLAATLRCLDPDQVEARIVGHGPASPALAALRALPIARVENRWVAEAELPTLLAWADVILLTHTQASQSGVAAAAIGAGRFLVATDVGGLAAQLRGTPGTWHGPPDAAALAAAVRNLPAAPPPRPDIPAAWRAFAADLLAHAVATRHQPGYSTPRTSQQDLPCPSASPKSARSPTW